MFASSFVAPYAGAWIEMLRWGAYDRAFGVAPYAGAWIEIKIKEPFAQERRVAPYAGAWIEISAIKTSVFSWLSRPTRARGLT